MQRASLFAPYMLDAVNSHGMNAPETVKALAADDGGEIAAPATPEEFKAKFDRECADLEQLIKPININCVDFRHRGRRPPEASRLPEITGRNRNQFERLQYIF